MIRCLNCIATTHRGKAVWLEQIYNFVGQNLPFWHPWWSKQLKLFSQLNTQTPHSHFWSRLQLESCEHAKSQYPVTETKNITAIIHRGKWLLAMVVFQLESFMDFQVFSPNCFVRLPRKRDVSIRPFHSQIVCSGSIARHHYFSALALTISTLELILII